MYQFGARSLPHLPGTCRFGSGDAPDPGPAAHQEEQVWMTS